MENFYNLTSEQLDLQAMTRDFALKALAPVVADCDVAGEFPMDVYKKAWDMGLTTMFIPEEYGGMGLDTKTCCVIREELGRVDVGFTVGVGSNGLAYTPVALAGTEEQKKLAAGFIVDGGFGAYCLTEPDGGSDAGEKIVEDNPEVDILQVAHMHITVNDKIGETPVVAVRNSGREIARIDVTLDADKKIKDNYGRLMREKFDKDGNVRKSRFSFLKR